MSLQKKEQSVHCPSISEEQLAKIEFQRKQNQEMLKTEFESIKKYLIDR